MKLTDYTKIHELDSQIHDLHAQLTALYQQRMHITTFDGDKNTTFLSATDGQKMTYHSQKAAWTKQGITVPAYEIFASRLAKAQTVLAEIDNAAYSVLLMPPVADFSSPQFTNAPTSRDRSRVWKVLVVHSGHDALHLDDYLSIKNDGHIMIGAYKCKAMSLRQYAALVAITETPIDEQIWSVLPQETHGRYEVLCVGKMGDAYHCVTDDARILIGDNNFRPVMEIK